MLTICRTLMGDPVGASVLGGSAVSLIQVFPPMLHEFPQGEENGVLSGFTPDHNGYDRSIQDPGQTYNPDESWVVQRPANGGEQACIESAQLMSAMHPTSVLSQTSLVVRVVPQD